MKKEFTFKNVLALLLCVIMLFNGIDASGLAEAVLEEQTELSAGAEAPAETEEAVSVDMEPPAEEAGAFELGELTDEPTAASTEEPDAGDAESVVTYCFIVDDVLAAMREAREGDVILRPEDPAAPEGMAFEGWFLEDGAPLFADGADSVIAHPDGEQIEINVLARFTEAAGPDDVVEVPEVSEECVRLAFECEPVDAAVSVYADAEAAEALAPEEDGGWLLPPGSYCYTAAAEGYESVEREVFTLDGPLTIRVSLDPAAKEYPAFDQSMTVKGGRRRGGPAGRGPERGRVLYL